MAVTGLLRHSRSAANFVNTHFIQYRGPTIPHSSSENRLPFPVTSSRNLAGKAADCVRHVRSPDHVRHSVYLMTLSGYLIRRAYRSHSSMPTFRSVRRQASNRKVIMETYYSFFNNLFYSHKNWYRSIVPDCVITKWESRLEALGGSLYGIRRTCLESSTGRIYHNILWSHEVDEIHQALEYQVRCNCRGQRCRQMDIAIGNFDHLMATIIGLQTKDRCFQHILSGGCDYLGHASNEDLFDNQFVDAKKALNEYHEIQRCLSLF